MVIYCQQNYIVLKCRSNGDNDMVVGYDIACHVHTLVSTNGKMMKILDDEPDLPTFCLHSTTES